jgi:hypothetical protein
VEFLLLGLIVLGVPFALPIIAWVFAYKSRARIVALEREVQSLRLAVESLSDRLAEISRDTARPLATPSVQPESAAPAPPVAPQRVERPPDTPASHPPEPPPPSSPELPRPPVLEPTVQPAPRVPPDVSPPPRPTPPPGGAAPSIPPVPATTTGPPAAAATSRAASDVRTPGSPRPPGPPPKPPTAPVPERSFDWENLVGVKLFSAIAGIALVLAAIFFLRYSVQQGWLQPPIRVLIGTIVGIALIVVCEMKAARRYPVTANALDAAAIAILFATFFAAHALWDLVPAGLTFALLAMVTAVAVLLSIRRESLFIAVLGLLGGFSTPALLSTGENRPVPLFAYLLLLNIGLAWVAYRQRWPVLTALTLVLTTIYQWGWVVRFLGDTDLPLAMGVFLVFPLVGFAAFLVARRTPDSSDQDGATDAFERTALLAAAMPLFFAIYLATVPAYGSRPSLLFGFLLLIDAGLLAITIVRGKELLHAAGAVATVLVMAAFLAMSYRPGFGWTAIGFTAAFVLLYLFSSWIAGRFGSDFDGPAADAVHAAPVLLFVFTALARMDRTFAEPLVPFGVLLVLVLVCAWRAATLPRGSVYFVAAFFAVSAQAVWATTHLTAARLGDAILVFGAFGAVSAGVPIIARRAGRALEPAYGGGIILIASVGLLLFLASGHIAPSALWALALLLAILNAGVFVESAAARLPLIAQAGTVLSWVVLASWWLQAAGAVGVLPALSVLCGLTLVTLGGHAWASRQVPAVARNEGAGFTEGQYLAVIGHLFLFFLAVNREWSVPPWPLFGALAVMTLATSATSLWTRSATLHAAGVIAAALVMLGWTFVTEVSPWTTVAPVAAAVISMFALAWIFVSLRFAGERTAAAAAATVLFIAELGLIVASGFGAAPRFVLIVSMHAANLGAILALAAARNWRYVSLGAVGMAALALLEWNVNPDREGDWQRLLVLTGVLYALFTAYPLQVGRWNPGNREPWIAALAAAAVTFFSAREAFDAGGLKAIVGVVPVVQGFVTAGLLRALLRLEPPGARDLGRLALVAGAALAFVTVAIPLQLEHQWITIGWALEGAALAWLFVRIPHRGLLLAAGALLAAVFVRLALNPAVFEYEPRGAMRIVNWYLYTYMLASIAMLVAARWLSRTEDRLLPGWPRLSRLLPAGAAVLLFLLLNIEIADYYSTGPEITFRFGATVSQDLTYTIGWLGFGMLLLAAGIYTKARPARIAAVTLIAVTTFKCFLYDLASLGGLYRVASFVGLALSLALVSLALQKYVLARPRENA